MARQGRGAAARPKGTHDVLWPESTRWEALLARFADAGRAGRLRTGPHARSSRTSPCSGAGIGEGSDVVGKEMYEFEDRGGRTLALRPEGTAPMVRAFVQHRPPLPWKAWYATPSFRYERPQAGRYRQHHQLGVEALGPADPDLDVEVIALADGFLRVARARAVRPADQLDGRRHVPARLPRPAHRLPGRPAGPAVRRAPRNAWTPTRCGSSTASARRAVPPPTAPRASPTTCATPARRTSPGSARASTPGDRLGPDHRLVRGFDYYTRTTFEFASEALESAQNGDRRRWPLRRPGGMLGGPPTPGIGFGMRDRAASCWPATPRACFAVDPPPLDAFVVDTAGGAARPGPDRRAAAAGLSADRAFDGRSMKAQFKAADRSGAPMVLIVGPDEAAAGTVSLRPLRGGGDQRACRVADVVEAVRVRHRRFPRSPADGVTATMHPAPDRGTMKGPAVTAPTEPTTTSGATSMRTRCAGRCGPTTWAPG